MDFVVNLETTKDYEPSEVVTIIKNALDAGLRSAKIMSKGIENKIIIDLMDNHLVVERV